VKEIEFTDVEGIKIGHAQNLELVAVNCLGDVIDPKTGKILAGALNEEKADGYYSICFLK